MIRHLALAGALVVLLDALLFTPPIPQDPIYHQFADQRTMAGVPNALNVLSNFPFAFVGVAGLLATFHRWTRFRFPWERWPYAALFTGVALTAVGSSYYHLAPDNARLVWDRLPMTIGFMGFLTATIAERNGVRAAWTLFVPLLAFGAASVLQWHWSELQGAGDLRWYLFVQFGSLATVALMLALYPPRYTHASYVVLGLGAYALAKLFELGDQRIFDAAHIISGHSLKHLCAAAGAWCLAVALKRRYPLRG